MNGSCSVHDDANQRSHIRSILNFNSSDVILVNSILSKFTKNFKLLKVLDFEDGFLDYVHNIMETCST